MKTALFKALLGSALLLLLMFACTLALRFYKTIVPEHVDRDTINFTAVDLEQAREKWSSSGLSRYEMRLITGEEEYSLRVDESAGTVEVLDHYIRNQRQFGTVGTYALEELYDLTVPGLFDAAREKLSGEPRFVIGPDENGMTRYYDYWADFDAGYGHPVEISDYERGIMTTREIVWRTTLNKVEVKDFKPLE
jgi:hypothetical protein